MKIGLEVTGCLTGTPTGVANYIINLHNELARTSAENYLEPYVWLPSYSQRDKLPKHFGPRKLSWHYKNYNLHRLFNDLDISHSTDSKFLNLPGTKKVATVHDLAIFRKETLEIPEYTTEKFKLKMLGNLQVIARKADQIITASNRTKLDFLEMFPRFDPDRIETIHLAGSMSDAAAAGNEGEILRRFGVEKKAYFIFVGAVSVRKNLVNMIRAFKESGLSGQTKFLLVGFKSMGLGRILRTIEENGLGERVVLADYVEDGHLPALYRNALGLAFATFYEGFGIPIIEAMRLRTPVMYGTFGSAPEIGLGHGLSVDPFSVGEIAEGFTQLIEIKDDEIEAAYRHAQLFSWAKTAEKTLAVYKKIIQ